MNNGGFMGAAGYSIEEYDKGVVIRLSGSFRAEHATELFSQIATSIKETNIGIIDLEDLEYIDRWSFWLDLWILVKTIPAVFTGRGAH